MCGRVRSRVQTSFSKGVRVFPDVAFLWHGTRISAGVLIVIPNCQGRVSPVFDVAARLTVVHLRDHSELDRREVTLFESQPAGITRSLIELGVEVLICGAISQMLHAALSQAGVRVISQICGDVEAVIHAYRTGKLGAPEFRMPGCCGRRWRQRSARHPADRQCKHSVHV